MTYPKECVNNNCRNIFYVKKHELIMCLQCPKCVIKRSSINEKTE